MKPLFVISDRYGFVAAFPTMDEVHTEVLDRFPGTSFLVTPFVLSEDHPGDVIYVIPYKDNDVVAFVSNDPELCRKTHAMLNRVGITYPDRYECWEHSVGKLADSAQRRLAREESAALSEKERAALNAEVDKKLDMLEAPGRELLERIRRESCRVNILESVVARSVHCCREGKKATTETTTTGVPAKQPAATELE